MLRSLSLVAALTLALATSATAAQPAMHTGGQGGADTLYIPMGPGTATHQSDHSDADRGLHRTGSTPNTWRNTTGNLSGTASGNVLMERHHHFRHFRAYVLDGSPDTYGTYSATNCEYLKARLQTANKARSRYWYNQYLRCLNG